MRRPAESLTASQSDESLIFRIAACAVMTALCARLAVRLPFTPVPVTWQVAAVLFSGLVLHPRAAFAAQAAYLCAGMAGLPVFAFGAGGAAYLFNPFGTGGYLLSYPLAAWATAAVLRRTRSPLSPILASASGLAVIYAMGCVWLSLWLNLTPLQAIVQGAGWFLAWDAVKSLLAILAANLVQRDRAK